MLPIKAVDRLFERLALTYGTQWDRMWEGRTIQDVKTVWADELSGYASEKGLKCVAWALDNLPDRAPNLIQFRNICRQAPAPETPKLPEPKASPERMKAEMEKLGAIVSRERPPTYDHKAWAKAIISREEAGEKLNMTVRRFAREALGLQ